LTAQGNEDYIDKLLQNFNPSEVLIPKNNKNNFKEIFGEDYHNFYLEDWVYKEDYAFETLTNHFQTNTLKGFGIEELSDGIIASGAILYYFQKHNTINYSIFPQFKELLKMLTFGWIALPLEI
jgi:DNA mismatch repair protein MutS